MSELLVSELLNWIDQAIMEDEQAISAAIGAGEWNRVYRLEASRDALLSAKHFLNTRAPARDDARRLDWLEENFFSFSAAAHFKPPRNTLREAIDAAMPPKESEAGK